MNSDISVAGRAASRSPLPAPHVPATLQEALDPAWLAMALAPVSNGSPVVSVEVAETIKTMASKVRIAVRFASDPDTQHTYCVKAFLDDESEMGGATTIREAQFYLELAPHITMRVPKVAAALINREEQRGILIMTDLIVDGARFCSALEPLTAADAAQSLEQIARLHAAPQLLEDAAWLPCRIQNIADKPYFTAESVQSLLDDPRGESLCPRTRSAALLFSGMKALAARNAARPQTLLHGDCHAGNLYWTADGPGFTDWQLVQRGNWALDVAYHIAAILPVELAEREERKLLNHYLDTLRSLGCEAPDREKAWDDYRAAQIYGFYHWAITRRVQPEITHEFTRRLGAGVMRHDTYQLLGL